MRSRIVQNSDDKDIPLITWTSGNTTPLNFSVCFLKFLDPFDKSDHCLSKPFLSVVMANETQTFSPSELVFDSSVTNTVTDSVIHYRIEF